MSFFFHGKPDVGVPGVNMVEKYNGIAGCSEWNKQKVSPT